VETLERWARPFFEGPWFRAVHEGTLSRQQYAYTIANQHLYVRWTTRLIGHAVANSHDRELRAHWIRHLGGEIDHEQLLESDLTALGMDVAFVQDAMAPSLGNREFMAMQESLIGFRRDPVMLMAAPLVAEGVASRLDQRFVEALYENVRRWGIENPKRATSFIVSHIHFDGGHKDEDGEHTDPGHWELTRRILERFLVDDAQLSWFLGAMRVCMDGFARSYRDYAEDLAIFAAKPTPS
jgi:hypothetical protein